MKYGTVLFLILSAVCLWAAAQTASHPPPQVMPLSDIKPGMKGTVSTVFQGGKIEEFHVEVTGILDNFLGPGKHVILCKMPDAKTWNAGGTAGMSGSPLLIDGKIVGALAYGLQIFETERYAGFTPIEDMLAVRAYESSKPAATSSIPTRLQKNGREYDFSALRPMATPLVASGLDPNIFKLFSPYFQSLGLEPLQAAGGADTSKTINAPFLPGAAVAGVLATGDINLAGTGTLTWREGNTILAFGHPFMNAGTLEMPMAQAEIVTILPSLYRSFKVANTRQIIGTITQDRLPAIRGEIGKITPMIPVNITLKHPASGTKTFRTQVMHHPQLTPAIMSMALAKALLGTPDQSQEMTLRLTGRAKIKNNPDLILNNLYSSSQSTGPMLALMDVASKLATLYANPHEIPRLESLDLNLDISETRTTQVLEGLSVDQTRVKPGQSLLVQYTTRSFRGPRSTHTLTVKIPEEAKSGTLQLQIADARTLNKSSQRGAFMELLLSPPDDQFLAADTLTQIFTHTHQRLFNKGQRPKKVSQIVSLLNQEVAQDAFYARLLQSSPGMAVDDKVSENIPTSILSVMDHPRHRDDSTPVFETELSRQTLSIPGVAVGAKSIVLEIQ